jgi:phage terminase Nu1 subunit (DNA packaging protein)
MTTKKASNDVPSWIKFTDDSFLLNSEMTAKYFNVTPRTLIDWAKRGAPKESRGWWNPQKLMEWLGKSAGDQEKPSDEARKLKADADFRERKAAKEEIYLSVLKGEFISKEEVDRQWSVIGNQLKSNMLLWTKTMAPELAHMDMRSVEKVLTDAVYDLLEQLSNTSRYRKTKRKKY